VTDLSHDAIDDGFHEIHLSGKQLVFLFMVLACFSVVIFLCGVYVGRGVRTARGDDAVEMAAATPASQPTPAVETPAPAAEPPAPPPETPDELSYHKRLQGETPAAETLKKPAAEPPPPAAKTPDPVVKAAQPAAKTPEPAARAPEHQAKAPEPAAKAPAQRAPNVPTAGKPGKWYVQVFATKDVGAAEKIVTRLAGKGYPAYLLPPAAGEVQALYRVRVGRYDDHNEAEAVKTRIAKEEQFQPYTSSR